MEKVSPYHDNYTGPDENVCEHCGTPLFYYVNGQSIREYDHLPNSIQCYRMSNANKAEKYDELVKENEELKRKLKESNELVDAMSLSNITPPPAKNLFQLQQDWNSQEQYNKMRDPRYGVRHI